MYRTIFIYLIIIFLISQFTKKNHIYLLSIILFITIFIDKREYFQNDSTKYCIIIPLYPPHYKYIDSILDSNKGIDIYFVFTNKEDYSSFPYKSENKLILDEYISPDQISQLIKKKSLPSFKKIFALNQLKDKYDYILCIDAETKIIKPPNLKKVYDTKVVIGGICKNPSLTQIIQGTLKSFKDNKINELSDNFNYYTWWSSMPVYKTNNISDFIEKIGFNDLTNFIDIIDYNFFENMAYNYYCMMYQNFKKIVVPDINHSLEGQPSSIVEKYIDYNIGWVSLNTYNQNKEFYDKQDNIFIIYHLDRY
jgi:hypothetical protein